MVPEEEEEEEEEEEAGERPSPEPPGRGYVLKKNAFFQKLEL